MEIHTFIAESVKDAVDQIRAKLGPEAVVLNVRKNTGEGLTRFFARPRIEVQALLPDISATSTDPLEELKKEMSQIKQCLQERADANSECSPLDGSRSDLEADARGWQVGPLLEQTGLLPVYARHVTRELMRQHGAPAPGFLHQVELAAEVLKSRWRPPCSPAPSNVRLLVGSPGSGKTTCLCKWLAQSVLVKGEAARIWRLDGQTANTAEMLAVYAEVLRVPLDRFQPASYNSSDEILFIDLPGANWRDRASISDLAQRIERLPSPEVHLVLNAAYDVHTLLAQVAAFSALPISSLILSHLDEEPRWGKLWNLLLGTNYSIGHFSAGQNIPGDFELASADKLLTLQFAPKGLDSQPAASIPSHWQTSC
jgi:flagellar biosynthesis protein FlhF